jgi:ATP-binding cassette subfamily C (CFTR/MRP) protein 2
LSHNASFNASFNTSFNDSMNVSSQGALQLVRAALSEHASRRRTQVCTGNVAYCPQVPAMHAGSIRSNILMGSEYDEQRYQEVLDGCCLYEDLQVS